MQGTSPSSESDFGYIKLVSSFQAPSQTYTWGILQRLDCQNSRLLSPTLHLARCALAHRILMSSPKLIRPIVQLHIGSSEHLLGHLTFHHNFKQYHEFFIEPYSLCSHHLSPFITISRPVVVRISIEPHSQRRIMQALAGCLVFFPGPTLVRRGSNILILPWLARLALVILVLAFSGYFFPGAQMLATFVLPLTPRTTQIKF